jgi:hypothetical protein
VNGTNGTPVPFPAVVPPSDVTITEKAPAPKRSRAPKQKRYAVIWQGQQIWKCEAVDDRAAMKLAEEATGWAAEELEIREVRK